MLTAIGDIMREAHKRNWITTRDGNISLRRGNSFYITPSGWRKTIIHPEHIIKFKILETGKLKSSTKETKPSGELEMHHMLQTQNWKAGTSRAVVHLHPPKIISAMLRGFNLQTIANVFPEVYRYTRVGPSVEILPATSKVLAKATLKNMLLDDTLHYQLVGQENHGVCAVAKTPWDAFEHIERLEHACMIVLDSGITPEQLEAKLLES